MKKKASTRTATRRPRSVVVYNANHDLPLKGKTVAEVTQLLMQEADKRKLALYTYRKLGRLQRVFSLEDVTSELNFTIALTAVNYGESIKRGYRGPLRFTTFGILFGYMFNGFKNNMAKKRGKYNTYKRTGTTVSIEALIGPDMAPDVGSRYLATEDRKTSLLHAPGLRSYISRVENQINEDRVERARYGGKQHPPSQLLRIFDGFLNGENHEVMRQASGYTDYLFKKDQKVLFATVRRFFDDQVDPLTDRIDSYRMEKGLAA